MKKIASFLLYNIFWFAIAHMAAGPYEALTLVFPVVLFLLNRERISKEKYATMMVLWFAGVLFDFLAQKFGLLSFQSSISTLFPLWLLALWALFILIVPDLFETFKHKRWQLAILGAIFGPLSYSYGERLQIITGGPLPYHLFYAIFWGAFMTIGASFFFANKLNRSATSINLKGPHGN